MVSSKESVPYIERPVSAIALRYEIYRKLIHLAALIIPVGYSLFGKSVVLFGLAIGLIIACATEILRQRWGGFSRVFDFLFAKLLREFEVRQLTGATYLLLGSFVTVLFFSKPVALFSLYMMVLSDTLSALVGLKWGRTRFLNQKSLEGSLAFFLSALLWGILVFKSNLWPVILGTATGTFLELDLIHVNDNLLIPLGTAIVIELALRFLG
ncbi:hypothetical protein J7K19_03295 [bacterium]|nr:hypothetical protein [bacterium]